MVFFVFFELLLSAQKKRKKKRIARFQMQRHYFSSWLCAKQSEESINVFVDCFSFLEELMRTVWWLESSWQSLPASLELRYVVHRILEIVRFHLY